MSKKVLAVADDPGGGLAVGAVLEEMRNDKSNGITVYTGELSEKSVKDFDYRRIKSEIDKQEAERIIDKTKPDILITGTGGGNAEQMLRNAAFERNLKSIVILDFWKDYRRRWLYAEYDLKDMKELVFVMDEMTKSEMEEEGFPGERITVTGQPYLDKIFNHRNEKLPQTGNTEKEKVKFLLLSQPMKILGVENYEIHPFEIISGSIAEYGLLKNKETEITIKPHPSEKDYMTLEEDLKKSTAVNMKIKFATQNEDTEKLIRESDIVIGFNTIAMFESRAMNKRTICLNAAPMRNSLLSAMKNAGIEITFPDLSKFTEHLLNYKEGIVNREYFSNGIINSVKKIRQELSLN
ncbi:MAG: hypothetical protein JNJ56_08840 [Ignavibacteria bacterium]|nr:hypothetical protein [Ignavibacteria bacterium]